MAQRYSLYLFLLIAHLSVSLGLAQEAATSRILVQSEVHPTKVLLRWIPSDSKSWLLLNQYGVRLERLTIAHSGQLLEEPELQILAERLLPEESDSLKSFAQQYPMGAVVAQAIFGDEFSVGSSEHPIARAISLDEEYQQRYLFSLYAADLCFPVAKEVGWGWEDLNIKAGERYLYRVVPLVPREKLEIAEGAHFLIADEETPFPKPIDFSLELEGSTALLSWDYHTLAHRYPAYILERSDDSLHFSRVSDLPITQLGADHGRLSYIDSVRPYQKVYYRIAGLTSFGQQGPYSSLVFGEAYPPLMAVPSFTDIKFDEYGGVELHWEFDRAEESLLEGFNILQSRDDGEYTTLAHALPREVRNFHVKQPSGYLYYKVEALSRKGERKSSLSALAQPIDSIPPQVPKRLEGEADSLGVVQLSWQSNKDEDIYGYRLFRGETKGGEMIPLNDLAHRDTTFRDSLSLNSLNQRVYYAITALDERYNQSEMSDTIEVVRPSKVPPLAPKLQEVRREGQSNCLEWSFEDKTIPIAGFIILRSEKDKDPIELVRLSDPSLRSYEDKSLAPEAIYYYQIAAYSRFGVMSELSAGLAGAAISQPASAGLSLELLPKGIAISWHMGMTSNHSSVILYKKMLDGSWSIFRENLPAKGEIVDGDIYQNKTNEYQLIIKRQGAEPIQVLETLTL